MSVSSCTASSAGQGGGNGITAFHPDIIQTHILTRLDGATLASACCASSQLRLLSTEEKLWRDICNSTWPSTTDPRVQYAISSFAARHRSFFSDSFPSTLRRPNHHSRPSPTPELISAIDIHYGNKPVFSKVLVMETESQWFQCSPFRVDLLDPKESFPTPMKFAGDDDVCRSQLEDSMTLSWIAIDPTNNRAVNISSVRPVWVRRHWLSGDIRVKYAMILAYGYRRKGGSSSELVECEVRGGAVWGPRPQKKIFFFMYLKFFFKISLLWPPNFFLFFIGPPKFLKNSFLAPPLCEVLVTCGGKEGGDLHVREVSMQVEDMDGKVVSGKDSLVILQKAMGSGRRKKCRRGEEKEKYEQYLEMKRERKERKQKRERSLDMLCIITGVTILLAFWAFIFV